MSSLNRKLAVVRVTTLAAALMGVYGVASATLVDKTLLCDGAVCAPASPVAGENFNQTVSDSNPGNMWVVKGDNANFSLTGGTVNAVGQKLRGVGATLGSQIILDGVAVTTNAGTGWGSHGVQATGNGSVLTINDTRISTAGESYNLGVQSYDNGVVQGSNNTITAKGTNSFGIEASYGGRIELIGGSITTEGDNAAGVRAFTGPKREYSPLKGFISLDGTSITTEQGIGLMAGDVNEGINPTAGDITYKNAAVLAKGADAARVMYGSSLTLENATLESKSGNGITADGVGSTVTATNSVIKTSGTGDLNSGINASGQAVVNVTGGSIAATGLGARTRGILAETGAKVTTNNTAISTLGNSSHAVQSHVEGGDTSSATAAITLNGGTVSTAGDNSYGLYALRGATITSSADIKTSGKAGFGAFVERNGEATARAGSITLNNGSITTTGEALDTTFGPVGSFGVLAKNAGSTAAISGTRIQTSGALADALRVEDGASISAANATVSTSGSNAHGVSVYGGGTVTMQGGSIAAAGEGASAAFVKDSGTVILSGISLSSTGATLASNFTQRGQAQTFTLGSGTSVLANNGELLRVTHLGGEDADNTVVLNFKAGSFAQGNVYDMTGTKHVTFAKDEGAQWAGMLVDQSTQQIDPSTPPAPNYTTTENVIVTSPAPVIFAGTTSMGGFSGATGGSSTFSGSTSITGDLIGAQGSSTNFSNNANIGGSITSGTGSTTTFSGPSTTIGGSVGGNGGTFAFSRTGSTSIGGSLNLSGSSQVTGGTIDNPITVGGDATVGAGSVLGGNLVVAGALGGSGGVVAPGNSIGTQTYGSSAGFAGNYAVEVNAAGKSDLIIISNGNFDLSNIGLTVGQENGNGGYVLNHDYTIIQTPGGLVQNTFKPTPGLDNSFAGTLVKLDPVKYGAKDVKVSLSVDNSAAQAKRAGLTGNQNATLDGVLSVAGKNTAADAALQSTDTAGALNQLSGEVHASTSSALLAAGGLVQRTVAQRMRGNLGVGMMAGAPTAQAGGTPVAGSMPQSAALPLWAQVVGNWNTLSDDGNAAKVKSNMGGVFIGGDTAVGSGWRVGGALGFTDGQIDVDDRSSRTKARSYTASLYGGNSWATGKGSVNFLAGAAYTRHNLDSRRSITLAGGQKLTADYHANSAQLFTELGYALPVGAGSVIEPYAGLAWLSQRMQGFSESGGSAALRGDSQTDTVTTFTLGLRGKTTMELSADKRVTLFAGLGWRHASGDVTSSRNLAFIQGNGASFQVSGAPIAKNAALLDAGVEASLGRNAALGLSYNGQYGNGNTNHVGSLYVKMRF